MVPQASSDDAKYSPILGGSVYNTARALGRLGADVGFLSGISTDPFGEDLIAALTESYVDTSLVKRGAGLTTLAFVQLENGNASYRFYDEHSAGRMIFAQDFQDIPVDVSALYFGGISLCFDPAASTYHHICSTNHASTVTMIDPNVRPDFVTDKSIYFIRLRQMIAMSDIVKVSDDDLALLIEGQQDPLEKLAMLKSLGPSVAILTRGQQGALAMFSGQKIVEIPAAKVIVKDTISAGDTFNAGVLAKLESLDLLSKNKIANISGTDLQSALEYGVKAAAIVVQREGANPPWGNEI